jgi:hypothetical protein
MERQGIGERDCEEDVPDEDRRVSRHIALTAVSRSVLGTRNSGHDRCADSVSEKGFVLDFDLQVKTRTKSFSLTLAQPSGLQDLTA